MAVNISGLKPIKGRIKVTNRKDVNASNSGIKIYTSSRDGIVKKINSNGYELWTFDHGDTTLSVAFDSLGNVYSGSGGLNDQSIKKLDKDGNLIWTYSNPTVGVNGLIVDDSDNVYAALGDEKVQKLDPSGNVQWTFTGHQFDSDSLSQVDSLAIDSSNNIISRSFVTVKKLTTSGNEAWSVEIVSDNEVFGDNPPTISPTDVAVDSLDNVYATYKEGGGFRKFNSSNGNELWMFDYFGEWFHSVAIDDSDNIYIGDGNGTIRQISTGGTVNWQKTIHGDRIEAIDVDKDGNIYTASRDNTAKRLDPNGNVLWTFSGHAQTVNSIAVDSNS